MALELKKAYESVQHVIDKLKLQRCDASSAVLAEFGFLKVQNGKESATNNVLSQFIHLAGRSSNEAVANFIIEGYKLPVPDLILSIQTGGINIGNRVGNKSDIPVETEGAIECGVAEAAKATNAWVMTSGINRDMVSLIGKALRSDTFGADVPCIGFSSWEYIAGHEELKTTSSQSPVKTYNLENIKVDNVRNKNCDLEPNHTHFLLFDDGPHDVEHILEKRQDIEYELSKSLGSSVIGFHQNTAFENAIPIVNLLLGGNFTSLKAICKGLQKGTPVVAVRDTGGLADIVANFCLKMRRINEWSNVQFAAGSSLADKFEEAKLQVFEMCTYELRNLRYRPKETIEQASAEIQEYINVLMEMNALIVIFDCIKHTGNLEDAISDALLKQIYYKRESSQYSPDFQGSRAEELKWCLIWNKAAYAREHILIDRERDDLKLAMNKRHFVDMLVKQALFEALCRSRVRFTALMIENGGSIEKFEIDKLKLICTTTMNDNALKLDWTLLDIVNVPNDSDQFVERIFIGYLQQYLGHYITHTDDEEEPRQILRTLLCRKKNKKPDSTMVFSQIFHKRKTEALYLWFLFMNQPKMAKYLCSRCRNQTVATLLAVEIYHKAVTFDTKKKEYFIEIAKGFDQHSMGIIDDCFAKDKSLAINLLTCKAIAFYNCTPLDVARRADCRTFLASNTVQQHLTQIWYRDFDDRRRPLKLPMSIWIFIASLLIPLIPVAPILFPFLYKDSHVCSKKIKRPMRYRPTVTYRLKPEEEKQLLTVQDETDEKVRCHKLSVKLLTQLRRTYHRFKDFYKAPAVRFYYHATFFSIFLALFSYVLLVDYFPLNNNGGKRSGVQNLSIPITEIILHICMWSLIVDECYQLIHHTMRNYSYISSIWNWMDLLGISFYLIAFITRFFVIETYFIVSKIFMSIDLVIWTFRVLHFFTAYKILGPKLLMIFKMTRDAFLIFVCFIFVLLVGFSISSWSLLSTNNQVTWFYADDGSFSNVTVAGGGSGLWRWQLIRDVFNWGIWKVFGQIDEPYNSSVSENDVYGAFVFILAIIFTMISNVLLLNILIAMFNATTQRVQEQSDMLWRYQRFLLIYEYIEKTFLPPPLSVLCYPFVFIMWIYKRYRECQKKLARKNQVNEKPSDSDYVVNVQQINREKLIGKTYWKHYIADEEKQKQTEITLKTMEKTLKNVNDGMDKILRKYDLQKSIIEIHPDDIESIGLAKAVLEYDIEEEPMKVLNAIRPFQTSTTRNSRQAAANNRRRPPHDISVESNEFPSLSLTTSHSTTTNQNLRVQPAAWKQEISRPHGPVSTNVRAAPRASPVTIVSADHWPSASEYTAPPQPREDGQSHRQQ